MEDTKVLVLDKYEYGIIINALNEFRTNLIKQEQSTDVINELLLKVIDAPDKSEKKKNIFAKTLTRDNERRFK